MAFELSNALDRSSPFSDFLRNHHFHIMDVSFSIPVVLTPIFGFKTCTAPGLTVQTKEIKEGNYEYKRYVVQSAETDEITLTQGARYVNSDFYDWIKSAVDAKSKASYRKKLLLVQFSAISTSTMGNNLGTQAYGALNNLATAGTSTLFSSGVKSPNNSLVERIPARAWMLNECIPVRYKSGTDFDAMSVDISLMELTIKYTNFTEFNMGL